MNKEDFKNLYEAHEEGDVPSPKNEASMKRLIDDYMSKIRAIISD